MPEAPSMSNLASPRVLPPFLMASSMSASRCAWMVRDMARSSSPRWAKVSARSAGPPSARAKATAAPRSRPSVLAWARGSSVVGSTRVAILPVPATHAPEM